MGTNAPVEKTTEEPARRGNPFRQPIQLPGHQASPYIVPGKVSEPAIQPQVKVPA